MKRDTGVAEIVAAMILIVITVLGAGIVMSIVMDKPSQSAPVLEYYGCNMNDTIKCLVHAGGETLYHGMYELHGLNSSKQRVDIPEWNRSQLSDFKMESSVCTYNADVSFIQILVFSGSGDVLHGAVPVEGSCSGVVEFGTGMCDGGNNPYNGIPDIIFNPKICIWTCSDGLPPFDNSCKRD